MTSPYMIPSLLRSNLFFGKRNTLLQLFSRKKALNKGSAFLRFHWRYFRMASHLAANTMDLAVDFPNTGCETLSNSAKLNTRKS